MKWIAALTLMLLALLAALWLAQGSLDSGEVALTNPAAPVHEERVPPSLDSPEAPPADPRRAAVAPAAPESTVPVPGSTVTLLRVHVTTKEDGAPMGGEVLGIEKRGTTGGSCNHVDGGRGRIGECPRTDALGWAEFEVEPGMALELEFFGVYWSTQRELEIPPLSAGEQRELEVRLPTQDDVVLHGVLLDADSRQVVPDGTLQVEADQGSITYTRSGSGPMVETARAPSVDGASVHSDQAGRFQLRGKSWLRRFVSASAAGYARTVFPLAGGHSDPARPLEVRMSRAAAVEVKLSNGGGPIAEASVELSCHSYHLAQESEVHDFYGTDRDPSWSARSDAVGIAIVEGLPPRVPLRLVARCKGFPDRVLPEPVLLAPGERKSLSVAWGTGGTIRGLVTDGNDRPLANLKLWRRVSENGRQRADIFKAYDRPDAVLRTDEYGRFEFADVPTGIWQVGVAPVENPPDVPALAKAVELAEIGVVATLDLKVDLGLYLRGNVLDSTGQPAPECSVSAQNSKLEIWINENSKADGSFVLGPLPAGTWRLEADPYETTDAPSNAVVAGAGTSGLVLKLKLGGVIAGKIVADSGGDAIDARVKLCAKSGRWGQESRDGTFRFQGVVPGSYVVWACNRTGEVGCSAPLQLEAGAALEEVEVRLVPGARLELRYSGKDALAHYSVIVRGQSIESDGVLAGTASAVTVPAGPVEIRWREMNTGVEGTQALTLVAGEKKELAWDGKP